MHMTHILDNSAIEATFCLRASRMFVLKPGFTSIVCMHLERVFTDGNLKILCRSLYVLGLECSSDKAKALSLGVHLYPLFLTLLMRS